MAIKRSTTNQGTTLVELLVVIVILLIGILGILQVFPGGLGVLRTTRGNTVASELSRAESDRMKGYDWQLPEEIRGVKYSFVGSTNPTLAGLAVDPSITINTLIPDGPAQMQSNGEVIFNSENIGYWPYVVGANLMRRVIGEGGPVPAPRQVGAQYGSLLSLLFSPIAFSSDPAYNPDPVHPLLLQVYGNDLVRREGNPGLAPPREWMYFVEDADTVFGKLYIPRHATKSKSYRLELTAWYNNPGQPYQDIETQVTVPANAGGGFEQINISTLPAVAAFPNFTGAEFGSVRLARLYDMVPNSTNFTDDPYEYVLLDDRLGTILLNPIGHNYVERRDRGRRIPLVARVNYDVFDWRIIRDEFRVPDTQPYQVKFKLPNLKIGYHRFAIEGPSGKLGPDNLTYNGMDVPVRISYGSGTYNFAKIDVILVDVDTGGYYLYDPTNPPDPNPEPGVVNDYLMVDPERSSYAIDHSVGFVRFRDFDRTTPGLQLRLFLPGDTTPTTVNAAGRRIRALYQGFSEWAVQVMKSPSRFRLTYGAPQRAEYYVGGSGVPGGIATRIYFPTTDGGKNVTIGEIWYTDGLGNVKALVDQNFNVQTAPADPLGPYVEIKNVDPSAAAFDFSNGYSVRYVRGASIIVRTLWNPTYFYLGSDQVENWNRFEIWSRSWRRGTVETYLQRGEY